VIVWVLKEFGIVIAWVSKEFRDQYEDWWGFAG
jgi:hypothetical protein